MFSVLKFQAMVTDVWADSANPGQTTPDGAVQSGSALFANLTSNLLIIDQVINVLENDIRKTFKIDLTNYIWYQCQNFSKLW